MSQHGVFVQYSCGISRRDGAIIIEVLKMQTKKSISLILPNILPKLFKLGTIHNWRQLMSCGGSFRKKLTNADQKLRLGEGAGAGAGLATGDVHMMKEILEDENTEKQTKY